MIGIDIGPRYTVTIFCLQQFQFQNVSIPIACGQTVNFCNKYKMNRSFQGPKQIYRKTNETSSSKMPNKFKFVAKLFSLACNDTLLDEMKREDDEYKRNRLQHAACYEAKNSSDACNPFV